jgi:hypothetical protein
MAEVFLDVVCGVPHDRGVHHEGWLGIEFLPRLELLPDDLSRDPVRNIKSVRMELGIIGMVPSYVSGNKIVFQAPTASALAGLERFRKREESENGVDLQKFSNQVGLMADCFLTVRPTSPSWRQCRAAETAGRRRTRRSRA